MEQYKMVFPTGVSSGWNTYRRGAALKKAAEYDRAGIPYKMMRRTVTEWREWDGKDE